MVISPLSYGFVKLAAGCNREKERQRENKWNRCKCSYLMYVDNAERERERERENNVLMEAILLKISSFHGNNDENSG